MPENAETNRLKVAIIGCGRVSEKHIRAVTGLSDRLMLCALADTNPDAPSHLLKACKKKIKKYNEVVAALKTYIDYKEMLSAEKPDIVAITVLSGLHFQIAKDCLESGCHILLEKPMTREAPVWLRSAVSKKKAGGTGAESRVSTPMETAVLCV